MEVYKYQQVNHHQALTKWCLNYKVVGHQVDQAHSINNKPYVFYLVMEDSTMTPNLTAVFLVQMDVTTVHLPMTVKYVHQVTSNTTILLIKQALASRLVLLEHMLITALSTALIVHQTVLYAQIGKLATYVWMDLYQLSIIQAHLPLHLHQHQHLHHLLHNLQLASHSINW
jgi:hypothetical protein